MLTVIWYGWAGLLSDADRFIWRVARMYSVPLGTGGPIRQNNCSLLCRQGEEDNEGKYNFIKYRMLQVRKLKYDAWNIMFGFKKKEATLILFMSGVFYSTV